MKIINILPNQAPLLSLLETGATVVLHRARPGVQEPAEYLHSSLGTEQSFSKSLSPATGGKYVCEQGMVFSLYGRGQVPKYPRL